MPTQIVCPTVLCPACMGGGFEHGNHVTVLLCVVSVGIVLYRYNCAHYTLMSARGFPASASFAACLGLVRFRLFRAFPVRLVPGLVRCRVSGSGVRRLGRVRVLLALSSRCLPLTMADSAHGSVSPLHPALAVDDAPHARHNGSNHLEQIVPTSTFGSTSWWYQVEYSTRCSATSDFTRVRARRPRESAGAPCQTAWPIRARTAA